MANAGHTTAWLSVDRDELATIELVRGC